MSNIQTGAERMPHDLSHLGFLAGQIGRLITISTTPVIAGDSFEMDAVGALRLSPLRRGLARILVIILLLHFLSLMLGSVLVLMLPLLVWLTPDLRIKKSLLKCNWTIRKRLPRCKMRLKKRLLAFSRRLHARIRKTRYMHKMRCLLINRRS